MILYSSNSSPYSAPVRVAIYAKDLRIEIAEPPGGLRSSRFHAINPVGTIPCLVMDDGFTLPESLAIMAYIDERFPERPLMPDHPELRAQVRVIQRIAELGIMNQSVELQSLVAEEPKDESAIAHRMTRLVRALASAEIYLSGGDFAIGASLTLADCQLAPALFAASRLLPSLGKRELLDAYPKVAAYFDSVQRHPAVRRVLEEMQDAG